MIIFHGFCLHSNLLAPQGIYDILFIREPAQLDGPLIISCDCVIRSAARYINADSKGVDLPLGQGARHMTTPVENRKTGAVAVPENHPGAAST